MDRMARQKQSSKGLGDSLTALSDESHPPARFVQRMSDTGQALTSFCRIQKLNNESSANLVRCTSRTSRSHSPTGTPTGSIFCFSCIVCAFTLSRSQHSQWKQLEQAGEVTLWMFQDLSSTYCPIDKSISYWIWVHRMSRAKQNPFWQYRLIIYDNIDCSFPSCFASTALRYHMQLWVERLSMSRPREIWLLWWKHGRLDCSSWRFLFANSMTIWTTGIHTVWPHGLNRSDLSDLSDFRLEMTGTPLAAATWPLLAASWEGKKLLSFTQLCSWLLRTISLGPWR